MPEKKRRSARPIERSITQITEESIAQLAYAKWIARGCPIGDGRDDWFAALAELEKPTTLKSVPRATG